jgi:glycosyltransferase involved in cell wall biosynthesis
MRALFVSPHFADDFSKQTFGVFKRLDLLVSAVSSMCSELDVLFYTPAGYEISEHKTRALQQAYSARWGTNITLHLCTERTVRPSAIEYYLLPIFDIGKRPTYAAQGGAAQVRAFELLLEKKHDFIFCHRLYGMMPILLSKRPTAPVFLDLDEIEHRWFRDSLKQPPHWPAKKLLYLQIPAVYLMERAAVRRAKMTLVCSAADRDYLSASWPSSKFIQAQNALPVPPPEPLTTAKTLMFLGSFGYMPNILAASELIEQIWPEVLARVPDAKLFITGDQPENIPSHRSAPPNVVFTGFVPDIDELYRSVRAVVCPIRSGGGTRLKIIEAALKGKAIVSTTMGCEGLGLQDGVHLHIRDSKSEIVEACELVLNDHKEASRIGSNARSRGIELYDKDKIAETIRDQIASALADTNRSSLLNTP